MDISHELFPGFLRMLLSNGSIKGKWFLPLFFMKINFHEKFTASLRSPMQPFSPKFWGTILRKKFRKTLGKDSTELALLNGHIA